MKQFNVIGEGAQHIVYQYIGEDEKLKDKVIRIRKPKEICEISKKLIIPFNQTEWTPLKQYFTKKQPYQVEDQQCEIMDNLFYDVVFAVELKPKTFLPILSNKQEDKDLCNPKNQRFYMMQLWKAQKKLQKQGKNIYECTKEEIDSITSKYDPRKFYNGKVENLFDAIIELQEYPENNYRLFGKEQKQVKQIEEFTNEEIASILSETLIIHPMIPQLKAFFHMLQQMNVTVEETNEAYQQLLKRGITEDECKQLIAGKCDDPQLQVQAFKLLTFSSFQALSDLSIIGSFRNSGTGKFVEVGDKKLYYSYSLVDVDLKPLNKIADYMSTIDELLKLRQYI